MHFFSTYASMSFVDAVLAAKDALNVKNSRSWPKSTCRKS
jgi:hypothetical protein